VSSNVFAFRRADVIDSAAVDRFSVSLAKLPVELLFIIASLLDIRSRVLLTATSSPYRALVSSHSKSVCATVLRSFSLSLLQLRFLQCATGCIVTGSFIAHVLEPSLVPLPLSLDIMFPVGMAECAKTFLMQCLPNCEVGSMIANHRRLIRGGWSLRLANSRRRILLYEVTSTDPMRTIVSGPTTVHFGAWSLEGLWHAYPTLLLSRLFMSSPRRLPAATVQNRIFLGRLLKLLTCKGLKFSPGWPAPHRCGISVWCPSTYRTTHDKGCLTIPFADVPAMAHGSEELWRRPTAVAWILGDWCCEGSENTGAPVVSATHDTGICFTVCSRSESLTPLGDLAWISYMQRSVFELPPV
jgi:hypothetical protein